MKSPLTTDLTPERFHLQREPAEAPSGLELPADRPRPPVASLRGATRELRLTAALTASLRQAVGRERASLDLLLLAGLAALLARYSGAEDLVIGAAGLAPAEQGKERPRASLLPLRILWTGDPSFKQLVAVADGALSAALANADLPFEALAGEPGSDDPARGLPFQVLFTGTGAERLPSGERKLAVDLALSVREVEGGEGEPQLLVTLDYAVDLFDATTAARLLEHYAALLAGAAAAPELPLSRLPLLGESERHQMLVEWNDTASAFPRRALHKLFEEQAAARPDAVAVVWDGGALTYGELDRQAGRIARRLRRLGVGPESRVALYLERSAEMVAAVLGVLKAGGAYLPIDLSYPRERLELLLEDAAPVAVVGTTRSLASLPGKAPQLAVDLLAVHPATARDLARRLGARFVPDEPAKALVDRLAGVYRATGGDTRAMMRTMARAMAPAAGEDAEPAPQAPAAEEELSADVPPESLAYVLYTSGSTGTPNGVEVTHEAVVRLVRETGYFPFGSGDVFLQIAPLSFDASTLELWGPLANGGCVALPPPGRFALGDLYEQVERHGVTAIFLTTGLFHVAVEEGLAGLAGLRHLLVGGDVMSRSHLERALAALPEVELIHCYGPTENTVFTSTWRVPRPLAEGAVTIGRLIANGRAYVLDPTLAPVPMGSAGELYLSGPGLARGYLHRRELTAERFLPNPFEEGRLYKTGDLVRWRPDGTLAFLGRHDFQVKVRGFRIEPGEIEAALLLHPQVREAAVVGLAEGGRDHRVVAYYVTEAGAETTREDLRAFLRARLPEHMVPAVLVPLAALPLTNVGKLDRRALPAPEALEPAAGEPATALGAGDASDLGDLVLEMLAGLWEDVLDPDPQRGPAADGALPFERSAFERSRRIGAHDDFFDLGGHSLSVMRLLSRIRQTFGVELGAQTVFAFPTLAAQARVVAAARRGAESALPPLAKVPRQGLPALSFAQQRLWFLDRLAPESPLYNVPSAYSLAGPLAPAALAAGLSEIVRRHEALRTRFVEVDGEPRQEIGAPWRVPLPQVDLRALGRERRSGELARLRAEEAGRPFRLARGPLLRAGLVRLDEEEHALLLTVHHIVYDGWSEGVLTAELTALYAAALAGRPSPLGELAVQYADFAAWQRAWPPEVLGRQLAYWRDELAGAPAALPLPVDRQRPAAPSFRGASAMLRLPAAALRQAARREGTTLYMLLLAGFAALLARVTGEEDLLVGTPVADRPRPEVEGLIGFFVNTVVIRARAAGDPSFRGLLAAVRDTALSAFAHQDLPFEMLVEELRPERERSRNPLVQVLFTFQGAGQAAAGDGAGLRLVRLPWSERSTAKLDLLLSAMEMPVEAGLESRGESNEAEITLVLEYAADLFTATAAARLLGHYATLVAGAAASPTSPELPLSCLPLLSAPELHQLIAEWNDTASGFPHRNVHDLFMEQAAARPDAIAVTWEGGPMGAMRSMSYGELDRRSGEIARHLRRLGVATDARVGIVVERSSEMVAALLGILKAGGGYLPLDPSYPSERLALMMADAAPAAVVGARHLLAAFPGISSGTPRLAFEDVFTEANTEANTGAGTEADAAPTVLRSADVPPASLAYVLYTSGSTGAPKGVEVSHRAVVRLVRETGYMSFGPGEVFLQLVPMSFDLATWEIWGALLNGGCLALLPPGPYTLADVYAVVARHGVTTIWLTSGLFHLAVEEGIAPLGGLHHLVAGGDVLSRPHVERALAALPNVDLINGYGPTENTSLSTTHRLRGGLAAGEPSVPIGRPIAASSAYVLDRSLALLPVGCIGELYVGGAGVARGYLGRPALTAERFLPDPFSADPRGPQGENRLYRTGDLARWRPDGTLDFLGRRDFQVKVRGFRVELGEVESALLRHSGVRDAVVTAVAEAAGGRHPDSAGGHRLVAYYVPEGADGPAPAELRAHLRESLPEHMVPSLFVPLAELPLNATGKVDRRALPSPETRLAGEPEDAPRTPPRNPVEEVIAGIWEDLLGLIPRGQPVGVDDDFFHLGGHSLLAIRLLSRLRAVLGADLPVQQVFDAPTIAGLAAAVARALVSGGAGGAGDAAAGPALPPLTPRAFADTGSADAAAPLSYAQQRLWFLDRLAPGSPAYNVPSAYGLAGPLAPAALAAALAEVVRRHQVLRARFVERDGEPRLEIAEAPTPGFLPLPLIDLDLSALAAHPSLSGRRSTELARLRSAEAERPFDLAAGPLLRAGLVRLGAEEHVLLLNFHHAVYDAWSEGVLLRELAALYDAARAGAPSPLAELVLQYADFAAWQRAWPPEVLGRQLAYWRGQLAGAPTALELPTDRPRPAVASLRGAGRRRLLGVPEVVRLRQAARREGATLYMLLLAAFAATLARHGGQEDLLVGTPVANRTRPEVEGLIGFFVNTLALRVRLAGDPAGEPEFRRVLASARQTVLAAFSHLDLPFEALVEELRPERDLSRAPLVQAMLSLGTARPERSLGGGLHLARLPSAERTTAKLDLSLAATELAAEDGGQSLLLELEYAADLFHATAAERLLAHFATLLRGAAEAPDLPLSRLPLLAHPERHQLVAEWNDTASGFPHRSVHGLFAEQAAARPDAVAIAWEGGAMTYGELDRRSGEIARHLRRLGVATDARVGLVVERSPEMVAALLGILKAGGGYLPLDPAYPRERLALLLADATPAAVVGPRRLLAALPDIPNAAPHLALEDATLEDTEADAAPIGADVPPTSLAYVLYTSGSTGTPKGVEVSHRAVVRLVRETGYASFGPGEVFLQAAPMSFDAATFDIWGPLLNGGCLALLPPGPFTLADLYAAVARHGVTTLWLTSGLFHLAVEEGLAPLAGLRQLLAGGDVLSRPHVERALTALPNVDLINGYGPTENTTFSTTHRLRDGLAAGETSVPIGRPIAASRAYVLDRSFAPLPVGCVGELYVGGAGVARGYLGRPALTADRFVPDPFSADPRAPGVDDRLYRTGDLARWRPDGTLDFLGRRDFQVKVRGFRVEPGEVESALLRHPGVRDAVVTAADSAGGHRLVAYYVSEGSDGPAPAELSIHLRESLPEHMVPSLFVPLAELPLNANGKVDRRALPSPEAIGEADTAPRTPPRNPVEEVIAGIWEDLLGLGDPVGVDDDFFNLGGHSLLVIRLLSRLRQAFGADLPVQRVFAAPTVAGLAAAIAAIIAAGRREEALPPLPPITPLESRHGVLPLSYPQRRLYFMDRLAPGNPTYNIPAGYLLRGPLAPAALAAALAEIVCRHEVLRTRIVAVANGEAGQEVCPPAATPLPLADLSGLPPARRAPELAALAGREARHGFDLRRGPMLRSTLVRLEEGEHALLLTLHHIASDGWSEGVLRRELSSLYAAALAGEPSPLAPLALQYADFAAWQRAWPEEALAAQLAHWKERLAGTPALTLPADRPRPPIASFRGDSLRLDLPPELAGALRRLARRGQATLFMTVLAAWHALLQRLSGQTDFAIGTPVANRTRPELEPLIGVFLNMLALRTDGGGDPSFTELLARVRNTALAAYDHADIPFERIVDEANVERDRSRPPLVQTMLALNSTPGVPFALRDLAVEPLDTSARVSRFDLSLGLSDQGGELGGGFEYSTDLFDRTTMARLAGHLVHLLAAVADDPSRRVAAIELLSPAERQQVAVELNDTAADLAAVFGSVGGIGGGEPLLHRWIERQAALTPDATAVVGESESLTYRELDARANRLARRLRRLGVRVDEPVAICAERSPALVVGLLAILKAGGAYLPLDPSYPSERLAFMIEDGLDGLAKPVLLAQVDLLAASVAGAGARLVDLDSAAGPAGEADNPQLAPLDGGAGADNLAYVIYTSGSTGRPKGVMSTHRGIINRIAWMQRAYGLTSEDRVLQKTPVSFDVSVWELFWPLVVGARLVLARPGGHRDPSYLTRRIEEQGVTTLHFVPPMLQAFLAHLAQAGLGRCRSLRRVMASGEALPAELAARFHELLGGALGPAGPAGITELHNLYGPTEASVDVTAHRTLPGPTRRAVPIGRPIANLGIWLLDPELQPVPLGVPGELYIGGTGLARGYLRRPGLTAERFVPHPLGRPGERLYRTGDLARFSVDGEIEFLGRTDDQVKLRGFRIEPGEIEAALAGHPAVREAAVVAREEGPGEVRLAAYVVPAGPGPRPEAGELRDALRRVLPEHMVPADFAFVDALPLTPSGKVDRGALRARLPADELAPAAEPDGDLENEIEEIVAGIWQDLLKRGSIGRDDDLFDVGAHSILAIEFASRVYDALGLEIPLSLLFESPTVRRLGVAIQDLLLEQIASLTDEEAELLAE